MKKLKKTLYYTLLLLFLSVFVYCAWQLISYYSESRETQSEYDSLSQMVEQARPTQEAGEEKEPFDWSKYTNGDLGDPIAMPDSPYVTVTVPETGKSIALLPEFAELYLLNQDLVGWISIEDTNVNYPVVQRKDETDYYLYRDFYGVRRARGCIYVREQCDVFAPSDNVVMYGHMMNDGTMFADLSNYTKKSFWEAHPYIYIVDDRGVHRYEIFAAYEASIRSIVYALEFDSDLKERFIEAAVEHSVIDTGITPEITNRILTLSTCTRGDYESRRVVHAYLPMVFEIP